MKNISTCKICTGQGLILDEEGICKFCADLYVQDPYACFDKWMQTHGFEDISTCKPEDVNLDRLDQAIEQYGHRCTKCNDFLPDGCEPWLPDEDEDEYHGLKCTCEDCLQNHPERGRCGL